jgi:hypothetical protein
MRIGIIEGSAMAEVFMSCYDCITRKKRLTLIETNPYLLDQEKFRKDLITSVSSSTAIETGAKVETIVRTVTKELKIMPVKTRQGSAR